jgi:predicted metal-dependent hydrolase
MYIQIIIILIILVLVKMYFYNSIGDGLYIKSNVDNQYYFVKKSNDQQNAADLIAKLKANLNQFCFCLKKKYPQKDNVDRMIENFKDCILQESMNTKYTSYSINKGEKMVFCLRHRDGPNQGILQDINTLMFVALHEMSHLASKSYHHTPEFYDNFKFLMREAIYCGVYQQIKLPTKYCGIIITNSPLN